MSTEDTLAKINAMVAEQMKKKVENDAAQKQRETRVSNACPIDPAERAACEGCQ